MTDYYHKGYREAVLFLFYTKGKILIEHRPRGKGQKEVFIPNGGIDTKDFTHKLDEDYKITAMKREIEEEFSGAVHIKKFVSLGTFIVEEIKIQFFGYLILSWEGTMPTHSRR